MWCIPCFCLHKLICVMNLGCIGCHRCWGWHARSSRLQKTSRQWQNLRGLGDTRVLLYRNPKAMFWGGCALWIYFKLAKLVWLIISTYYPPWPIRQTLLSDVKGNVLQLLEMWGAFEVSGIIPIQGKEFNVALVGVGIA